MATRAYLTFHDGKLDVPEDLQRELHLEDGVRLVVAYASSRQMIVHKDEQKKAMSPDAWRNLRGILSHTDRDLNAELEADRIRENELDARLS